ncbi:hypothetical protein WICPIJ_004354 [Wickerhamomyces pijperi]|uniref:Uncharacterized protein n=1 Tax=Wickerhamomyces pijperi TaxID=599730 RepID=A0A9P8Q632_WICPI|nr:hypothetical protein WICPIJ_004354 [Wickerhamomyces pijperi]
MLDTSKSESAFFLSWFLILSSSILVSIFSESLAWEIFTSSSTTLTISFWKWSMKKDEHLDACVMFLISLASLISKDCERDAEISTNSNSFLASLKTVSHSVTNFPSKASLGKRPTLLSFFSNSIKSRNNFLLCSASLERSQISQLALFKELKYLALAAETMKMVFSALMYAKVEGNS